MMAELHRSSSLPAGPSPHCETKEKAAAAYHVRSTSLPGRSHPFISQVEDEIFSIRTWQSKQASCSSSVSLWAGLSHVELLHGALDQLLQLAETQESLRHRRSSSWTICLLDDFLRLADAYGRFRDTLVSLHQIQSEAQAAIRRKDRSKLASVSKAMRKAEKEITKITSSTLNDLASSAGKALQAVDTSDAELFGILMEVTMVIASASSVIFSGFVVASKLSFSYGSSSWTSMLKKKLVSCQEINEGDWETKLKSLKEQDICMAKLENESERALRCLIKTRISLLNILSP